MIIFKISTSAFKEIEDDVMSLIKSHLSFFPTHILPCSVAQKFLYQTFETKEGIISDVTSVEETLSAMS